MCRQGDNIKIDIKNWAWESGRDSVDEGKVQWREAVNSSRNLALNHLKMSVAVIDGAEMTFLENISRRCSHTCKVTRRVIWCASTHQKSVMILLQSGYWTARLHVTCACPVHMHQYNHCNEVWRITGGAAEGLKASSLNEPWKPVDC